MPKRAAASRDDFGTALRGEARPECAIMPFRARNSRKRCRMPTVCDAVLGAGSDRWRVAALRHLFYSQILLKPLSGLLTSFDYCNCGDYGSGLQIPNPARKKGYIFQPLIA